MRGDSKTYSAYQRLMTLLKEAITEDVEIKSLAGGTATYIIRVLQELLEGVGGLRHDLAGRYLIHYQWIQPQNVLRLH